MRLTAWLPAHGLHVIPYRHSWDPEPRDHHGRPSRPHHGQRQLDQRFFECAARARDPFCFRVWSESESICVHTALWSWNFNVTGKAEAMPPE